MNALLIYLLACAALYFAEADIPRPLWLRLARALLWPVPTIASIIYAIRK